MAKAKTYICAHCKGEFLFSIGGDERAHEEAKELWGEDGHATDMDIVCDDCFKEFMDWYQATEQD